MQHYDGRYDELIAAVVTVLVLLLSYVAQELRGKMRHKRTIKHIERKIKEKDQSDA